MTTEFLPTGLLPNISGEFDRSLSEAGQLVTVFAAVVILTSTPLAALTRRIPRKRLALVALGAMAVANAVAAASPAFEVLLGARAIGGAAHAMFWVVAGAYAADLVSGDQLGRATAITAAGGSVAGVLGVPLGNALAQTLGWRSAFLGLAILLGIVILVVAKWLPPVEGRGSPTQRDADTHPPVRAAVFIPIVVLLLMALGQTAFSTYLVPWLNDVAQLPAAAMPLYLFVTGATAAMSVAVLARIADRRPRAIFAAAGVGMVAALALFPVAAAFGAGSALLVVAILSSGSFAVIPVLLQARVMRATTPERRGMVAAIQTTAINVAIGGGALVGGMVLDQFGLWALPYPAAALGAIGLLAMVSADASILRRSLRRSTEEG